MVTSWKAMKMTVMGRTLSRIRMMFSGRVKEKILLSSKFIKRIKVLPLNLYTYDANVQGDQFNRERVGRNSRPAKTV